MNDLEKWLRREYPDGIIDWKREFERLLSVADQACRRPAEFAGDAVLNTAIETGKWMLEKTDAGE